MKIIIVIGTRPEAIKMAPVIRALLEKPDSFDVKICTTGQHTEMLTEVLETFELRADIELRVQAPNQGLDMLTALILERVSNVLVEQKPDLVLVHGDTTTTFASALACFYHNIAIGHVEAGLRTHRLNAPFPEEFNRQVTSKIARYHFAPTTLSRTNLISEGVNPSTILLSGNTVIDALLQTIERIEADESQQQDLVSKLNELLPFEWQSERFILVTVHRRENHGTGLDRIFGALKWLANEYPNLNFVYPVHLNPNVREPAAKHLNNITNFHLIPPLPYLQFIYLLKYCYFVITDSGGIQEEAPSLHKPVLVLRDVTERSEALEAGGIALVGTEPEGLILQVRRLLADDAYHTAMAYAGNPFGDGKASERIVEFLSVLKFRGNNEK